MIRHSPRDFIAQEFVDLSDRADQDRRPTRAASR